jgi:glycosyltransferase involved in cell wall biosynthesis
MKRALPARVAAADLVHLHSIFLWPTWAAAREARRQGVPYVVSPRGMLEKELVRRRSRLVKSAWLGLIERRNLEGAAAVHFTSLREQEEARRFGYRFRREAVVPNGVEADESGAPGAGALSPAVAEALAAPGPFLLFLGRISWKKGIDRLIDALAAVPGARLVVAGNDEAGEWPRHAALAASRRVEGRVRYVGEVHGADKAALLAKAAALVLPSHSENFGNVVLEAMAAGCPVVVSPEVGAAEIVRRAGAGIVVGGDPATLGPALAAFLGDEAGRRACGERGRAAAERFAWPIVVRQMEDLYEECRAGARRSQGGRSRGCRAGARRLICTCFSHIFDAYAVRD